MKEARGFSYFPKNNSISFSTVSIPAMPKFFNEKSCNIRA